MLRHARLLCVDKSRRRIWLPLGVWKKERRDRLDCLPVHLPRAPARHCLEAPSSKNKPSIALLQRMSSKFDNQPGAPCNGGTRRFPKVRGACGLEVVTGLGGF